MKVQKGSKNSLNREENGATTPPNHRLDIIPVI